MYKQLDNSLLLNQRQIYVEETRPSGTAGVLLYRRVINRALSRLAVRTQLQEQRQ